MSEIALKSIIETLPHKIKDIGLAEDGRNAILISEKRDAWPHGNKGKIWSR